MIKSHDVVNSLGQLIQISAISEACYRRAIASMRTESEMALFIYFWQEHGRIVCELQEKVRQFGGILQEDARQAAQEPLCFRKNNSQEEIEAALSDCVRADAELLHSYEYVVKVSLPFDVLSLLRLHVMKVKGIHARARYMLERVHHSSMPSWRLSQGPAYSLAHSLEPAAHTRS